MLDILTGSGNANYQKAKIILIYLKDNNIKFNKKYIIENGNDILNKSLDEYLTNGKYKQFDIFYKPERIKHTFKNNNDDIIQEIDRIFSCLK